LSERTAKSRAGKDGSLAHASQPADKTASRSRRASGLSRERIIAETLEYLRAHPEEQFSLNRAAAVVGASPMAIYRHFRDGADLADALLAKILEGVEQCPDGDADWRAEIIAWMKDVYGRLVRTRQSVAMLANSGTLPLAWVRASIGLRRSLAKAGLSGPKLAEADFWITLTLSGFARQALATPLENQISGGLAALNLLEAETGQDLSAMRDEIPRTFSNALDIMLERLVASIEKMVEEEQAGN
jgi:AcrR family transcriptional regulator